MTYTLPWRQMRLSSAEAPWRTPVWKYWLMPGRIAVASPAQVISFQVSDFFGVSTIDSPLTARLFELQYRLDERWPLVASLLTKTRRRKSDVDYLIMEPAARWMLMLLGVWIDHFAAGDQRDTNIYTRARHEHDGPSRSRVASGLSRERAGGAALMAALAGRVRAVIAKRPIRVRRKNKGWMHLRRPGVLRAQSAVALSRTLIHPKSSLDRTSVCHLLASIFSITESRNGFVKD